MQNEIIISARDVHKTYQSGLIDVQALRGVSLDVRRKEIIAVMGPSGCGKTTLLNCLSGLDAADEGEIEIEGSTLTEMSDFERTDYRARRMGFVFQFYNLLPVLSAVENVEMPLLVSGTNPREARELAMDALGQVGLTERADHRPAALSGGERQRVTIARALVNNPAIVWADEPTGDLDSETADQVMDVLIRLNEERDLTFLLVTHARRVAARCSRIVRMRDGQIEGEQTPEEVLAQLSQIPSMSDE